MKPQVDIEDAGQLLAYLAERGYSSSDPAVRILEGGVSNRTVYIGWPGGEEMVLKQALAQLRVPTGWFSPPERVHREALGLRWLGRLEPPGCVPGFLFEDFDLHILAMTAVPRPHRNWKEDLLDGVIEENLFAQCGRILAGIGRLSGQETDAGPFRDTSYFESLRIEPYYIYTARQVPEAAPFLEALAQDALTQKIGMVHGDFSPKNFLIYDGRLRLLDHEVIHWGDPSFDIGFLMAHFLGKAHHMPQCREALSAGTRAFLDAYGSGAGGWEARAVRHTLGCLLARAAGRSQLEYLTPAEKEAQRKVALSLIRTPPQSLTSLMAEFLSAIT